MAVLQLLSDTHFEFHRDGGRSFIDSIDPTGADILVLDGDICLEHQLDDTLQRFCDRRRKWKLTGE